MISITYKCELYYVYEDVPRMRIYSFFKHDSQSRNIEPIILDSFAENAFFTTRKEAKQEHRYE